MILWILILVLRFRSFVFGFYYSNRQVELTSIKIRINKDNGKSRVIPGHVVKFANEFVVKISESIFQDEVKKCRLVWNGQAIGRGTQLYFRQVESSGIFSGIDLEENLAKGRENYWLFEFHPIPTYLEPFLNTEGTSNMCCIGHPHRGIKMVTFGRELCFSLERFDNQYRRISQPSPDSQGKEVRCVHYSCKTCPGSSGSPIFYLYEGIDWKISYIHFLGERVEEFSPDGELIENRNMA